MKILHQFLNVFRRRRLEAEMAEEMRQHVELQMERNIKAGMTAEDAHRAALRQFGNVASIQERVREGRGWVWLEQTMQDLRYAARQLARAPGFTLTVVLTLALGIGATTAIYSVVDRLILNPVSGPEPDRVIQIGQWSHSRGQPQPSHAGMTPQTHAAVAAQGEFFADLTWTSAVQFERRQEGFTELVFGNVVPAGFFRFFSVTPLLGRTFALEEEISLWDEPKRGTAIMLSYTWWQKEFGGDPAVLGTVITLSDRPCTVVGVMPPHFQFPVHTSSFWLAGKAIRPDTLGRGTMHAPNIRVIGRLKPAVTPGQVQPMLDTVGARLMQDNDADTNLGGYWRQMPGGLKLWWSPLREAMQGESYTRGFADLRRTLLGFLGAIGFVLLIACANTANLALARTERRRHELAIRVALGAGRGRLVRQLLTENLLLAVAGGLSGLLVTAWGLRLFAAFNTLPQLRPIEIDGRTLAISLTASLLTGLVFGLMPAWQGGRTRVTERLKQGGLGATAGSQRYRNVLVVTEVALAVVLLAGAGLMIQGVIRLLRADTGFDPENLLAVRLDLTPHSAFRPGVLGPRNADAEAAHAAMAALPGVMAVGILKDMMGNNTPIKLEGGDGERISVDGAHAGVEEADFFRAARIPLLAGRFLTRADIGSSSAVVVNETMARLCWPQANAVGRRFRVADRSQLPVYEVVGVVADSRIYGFGESARPLYYRPYQEADLTGFREIFLVRSQGDPAALVPLIREIIKTITPKAGAPIFVTMRQALYDSTQSQRTYRNYLIAFAGAGLLLAALGVYGVLAYSVAGRTREFGIRAALGADARAVRRLVMGEGMQLIGAGVAVGLLATFWLAQFLQQQLAVVQPADPLVLGATALVLGTVGLVACWLPARRAAKVDPMIALRAE